MFIYPHHYSTSYIKPPAAAKLAIEPDLTTNKSTIMQRYFPRQIPFINHISNPMVVSLARRFATAPHPNPGNFANRPKDKIARAGRKGGRKGGKAHTGSFQSMDPEKQVIRSFAVRTIKYTNAHSMRLLLEEAVL